MMATSKLEEELDLLKYDVTALRNDIKTLAATLGDEAKDRVAKAAEAARKLGQQGAQVAENQITTHPFASVAAAFGVGLLLGRLLHRR
jgi:ElaB/YqjD/DUF883 family membrane-anchored ribosome-binding protein